MILPSICFLNYPWPHLDIFFPHLFTPASICSPFPLNRGHVFTRFYNVFPCHERGSEIHLWEQNLLKNKDWREDERPSPWKISLPVRRSGLFFRNAWNPETARNAFRFIQKESSFKQTNKQTPNQQRNLVTHPTPRVGQSGAATTPQIRICSLCSCFFSHRYLDSMNFWGIHLAVFPESTAVRPRCSDRYLNLDAAYLGAGQINNNTFHFI